HGLPRADGQSAVAPPPGAVPAGAMADAQGGRRILAGAPGGDRSRRRAAGRGRAPALVLPAVRPHRPRFEGAGGPRVGPPRAAGPPSKAPRRPKPPQLSAAEFETAKELANRVIVVNEPP